MPILLALALLLIAASSLHAAITINIKQQGNNVVVTGFGTANTMDLGAQSTMTIFPGVISGPGFAAFGAVPPIDGWLYTGVTGPSHFGDNAILTNLPDLTSGDVFGIDGGEGRLIVPENYTSGSSLSGSMTYTNTDIFALSLTPGTYTWTWGSGPNADSLTLTIPEPASTAVLASLAALAIVALRQRRR